jgi:hypothetical protein
MKSGQKSADAAGMPTMAHAANLGAGVLFATAIIGAGLVLAALKIIASDLDYSRRCDLLLQQARAMRERQNERLRSLRPHR